MFYKKLKHILRAVEYLWTLFFYRRKPAKEHCDILFLHDWEGGMLRAEKLSEALKKCGYSIRHEIIHHKIKILTKRLLAKTERRAPFLYCVQEYYASFLIKTYRPKILITFMDNNVLSIFLKKEMDEAGGKVVNIAHGVTVATEHFTMFDFHYYFVLGQSSVDAALRQKTRYGSTRLVKTGFYHLEDDCSLPPDAKSRKILFLSTWTDNSTREIIHRIFHLLTQWAKIQKNYHLLIKHHPLEDAGVIRAIMKDIPNVTFLPQETGMKDALRECSLVLTAWSTASIEAALLNRPVVVVNDSDMSDIMELETYFTPRAHTAGDIENRIQETFSRYDFYLERAKAFAQRHLEHNADAVLFMVRCLQSIYSGKEDFECVAIEGTLDYFARR